MTSEPNDADEVLARIEAAQAALGRPKIDFTNGLERGEVLGAWAAAHPAEAAEWQRLQVEREARDAENARRAERLAAAARAADQLKRIVGKRIAEILANPYETTTLAAAREWDTSDLWSLVFLGSPGNGKSVAAAWLIQQRIARRQTVEWLRAQEVATESATSRAARDLKTRARGVDLLVIDDFGDESESGPWKAWLSDVLGARYANAARIVITSNLDTEAFKGRVGARLTDRFREGRTIGISFPSMRKSPAGAK